jgi:hypothetical protein
MKNKFKCILILESGYIKQEDYYLTGHPLSSSIAREEVY